MNSYEQLGRIVAARTFFGNAMEDTDLDSFQVLDGVIRILIGDLDDSPVGNQADEILDDLTVGLVNMIEEEKE